MFYSISGFGNEECELFLEKLPQALKNEKGWPAILELIHHEL